MGNVSYYSNRTAVSIEFNYNERRPVNHNNSSNNITTSDTINDILVDAVNQTFFTGEVFPHDFDGQNNQVIEFEVTFQSSNLPFTIVDLTCIYEDADGNSYTAYPAHVSDEQIFNITSMNQNIPNPFNPFTTISYSLEKNLSIPKIEIFNQKGQKVKSFDLQNEPGENSITWNGKDEFGNEVSSGVYFYRLINDGKPVQTKKMMLIR